MENLSGWSTGPGPISGPHGELLDKKGTLASREFPECILGFMMLCHGGPPHSGLEPQSTPGLQEGESPVQVLTACTRVHQVHVSVSSVFLPCSQQASSDTSVGEEGILFQSSFKA